MLNKSANTHYSLAAQMGKDGGIYFSWFAYFSIFRMNPVWRVGLHRVGCCGQCRKRYLHKTVAFWLIDREVLIWIFCISEITLVCIKSRDTRAILNLKLRCTLYTVVHCTLCNEHLSTVSYPWGPGSISASAIVYWSMAVVIQTQYEPNSRFCARIKGIKHFYR